MTERKHLRQFDVLMGLGIIMGNTRGYRYKDETGNRYGKLTVLSL